MAQQSINPIPTVLNNYRVYVNNTVLVGTADITLPSIEQLAETIKGAGIAGEVPVSVLGMVKEMVCSLKFRTIENEIFQLGVPTQQSVQLRAALQNYDAGAGGPSITALSVRMQTTPKVLNLGKVEVATAMDSQVDLNVLYLRIFRGGVELCEIDPFNMIYRINGTDYLAAVSAAIN